MTQSAHQIAAGLSETQRHDLMRGWDAACDADWQLLLSDPADFFERQEVLGFAELVPVDEEALEDAFAWERGIEPGGSMWSLTPLGLEVRAILTGKG